VKKTDQSFDLASYLKKWRKEVDRTLERCLPAKDSYPESIGEAMRYSVFAGGKRLRPILCIAGCEAVCGDAKRALLTGAAIEMIHTYSLIHDDLPAMDDDELRRGKPTCHKKFGEAVAILAGDALLTEAFGAIVKDPGLDPWLRNVVVAEVVKAAGVSGMIAGQVVDMEKEGKKYDRKDVEFIHASKTAAMISMSVAAGAIIGNGGEVEIGALRDYGQNLGLAFQIVDDVLNVTGGKELGKGVGTDASRGKATYPGLLGMDKSKKQAAKLVEKAKKSLEIFERRTEPLMAIADYVIERNK